MLLAYRATSPLAGLKEIPGRMLVAKWGRNESVKGGFEVNDRTARFLPVMQKLLGFDTISLDFEHNTVPGTDAYKADKEPRNIAATGRPVVVPGEGLYAEDLRWTPHGVKSVTEGLHPDLSPTIKTDETGAVVFLHSAALCRQGAVPDLQVFSAALSPDKLAAFSAALSTTQPTDNMDFKKLLLLLLGLDANAADSDIEAACTKFAQQRDAMGKAAADFQTHTAEIKALKDKLAALEQAQTSGEREALIAAAVREGKLIPNSIAKVADIAVLKEILAELPANVVPLAQRTPEGLKAHSASLAGANNSAEEEVARQMGVSADARKKYGDKVR